MTGWPHLHSGQHLRGGAGDPKPRGAGGHARGAALSVLAAVEGFLHFAPDSGIRGVILNGCSAMSYGPLARELENRLGVRACGYLPRLPECALESRHLGLITADEVADLQEKLRKLAAEAEKTLDIAALLEIAAAAPPLRYIPPALPEPGTPVRIGVARDRASAFTTRTVSTCCGSWVRSWYPSARWQTKSFPTVCRACTWEAAIRSFRGAVGGKPHPAQADQRRCTRGDALYRRVRRLYVPDEGFPR